MRVASITVAVALAALTVTACGGDGGDRTTLLSLTGAQPPAETWDQILERVPDVLERGDHFNISSLHIETGDGEAITVPLSCSGTTCTAADPRLGDLFTFDAADLPEYESEDSAIPLLTVNGVTAVIATRQDTFTAWSAWLDHGGFTVESYTGTDPLTGTASNVRIAAGGGDLTGSVPIGSATWQGVMTGTPTIGDTKGEGLIGAATLSFDVQELALDAAFTNIVNIDRLAPHSVSSVRFSDVPVSHDGTFAQGSVGNLISGGFYGPGHAETAGAFEKSNLIGAFGAKQ